MHAECGVFVHCKKGYILQSDRCVIDPALKSQAEAICVAVVGQLKVEYGELECNSGPNEHISEVPSRKVRELFE